MRFLLAVAAATICATLTCGTVNAEEMAAPEIEVMRALSAATSEGATYNFDGIFISNIWKSDTASSACSCSAIQKGCGIGWPGIKCEVIAGEARIVEIQIPFNRRISGNIGNLDLNKLPYLRRLDIADTRLNGTLPNLSTHPTLKSLELSGNPTLLGPLLTQHIPPQLERLYVRGSIGLSPFKQGPLPSFDAVNATTLKFLSFEYAQVSGTLPSFQRFINLEHVNMHGYGDNAQNKISGAVPRFGPALRTLVLSENALTVFDVSAIPATVRTLDLSKNKITAPFPDLSKLTDPWSINLMNNGFYGNVPISQIPSPTQGSDESGWVYSLNILGNSLSGPVPALTRSWLQSRQAAGRKFEEMEWYIGCNLFQTTRTLPPFSVGNAICYDNQPNGLGSCDSQCNAKVPGSVSPPNGNNGNNGQNGTKPGPNDPSKSSSTGPNNAASATTTTPVFTGIIAMAAAVVARF